MNKALFCILFIFCISLACQKSGEFHHVLLYSWSENIGAQKKEAFLEIFENLSSEIKGLENVRISQIDNSLEGHDLVIDLTFESKSVLKSYQNHPNHQKIENLAKTIIRDYSYFQYTLK